MTNKDKIIRFFNNIEITENCSLSKPERRKLVRQFNNILYRCQAFLYEKEFYCDMFSQISREKLDLFFKATKVKREKYNGLYRRFYILWKNWLNEKKAVLLLPSDKFSKKICSIIRDYDEVIESELLDKLISGNFSNKQLLEMYYSVHYYGGTDKNKVGVILSILKNRILSGTGKDIFTDSGDDSSPIRKFPVSKKKDFVDYVWRIKLNEEDLSNADEIKFKISNKSGKDLVIIQDIKFGSGNKFFVSCDNVSRPVIQSKFKGFLNFYLEFKKTAKASLSISTYKKRKILHNKIIFSKKIELNFGRKLRELESRNYTILWNRDERIIYFGPRVKGGSNYTIMILPRIGLELKEGVSEEMLIKFLNEVNIN